MNKELIHLVEKEEERGQLKWGNVDREPLDLMIAIQEELGEVAHSINHTEGAEVTKQEIAEVIGLLSRLYDMVDKRSKGQAW